MGVCYGQIYANRVRKGNSLNRRKIIKSRALEHQEGKRNMISKVCVNTTDLPSVLEFLK